MRTLYPLLAFLTLLLTFSTRAQDGYPVPDRTETRLFYIQHSNNHNAFVYDANLRDGNIPADNALDIYRIVYTEGGVRKPLTGIQRKMAYGMEVRALDRNSFEMNLTASKKLKFYLILGKDGKPIVYITVNGRKMKLDRMFVQLKAGSLSPKADWVLFTGTDLDSGQPVTEKVVPQN